MRKRYSIFVSTVLLPLHKNILIECCQSCLCSYAGDLAVKDMAACRRVSIRYSGNAGGGETASGRKKKASSADDALQDGVCYRPGDAGTVTSVFY